MTDTTDKSISDLEYDLGLMQGLIVILCNGSVLMMIMMSFSAVKPA